MMPNHRDKIYGGAWSIQDPEAMYAMSKVPLQDVSTLDFCLAYRDWIDTNRHFDGWRDFQHLDFCNGTTEAFDKFYQVHSDKRLRLFKGEYFYHQIQARIMFGDNFSWIGDDHLTKGDVVVVSCPFSDTGDIPIEFDAMLKRCDDLDIPVMIDMAYISISDIKTLDLTHPCIEVIATSLSKVFPVAEHRIGMRLRRKFEDDTLFAYNQNQYVNRHSVNLGNHLIRTFDNDWLINKYRHRQIEMCRQLNIDVSSCVIFGVDRKNRFPEYNRGTGTNRLCFSRIWDGRKNQ